MRETPETETDRWNELSAWAEEVFTLGQRLRLRLGPRSEVVTSYEVVRERWLEAAPIKDEAAHEEALQRFEAARDDWLAAAKADLDAKIAEDD